MFIRERLRLAPAVHAVGAAVPGLDAAVQVKEDDGVVGVGRGRCQPANLPSPPAAGP